MYHGVHVTFELAAEDHPKDHPDSSTVKGQLEVRTTQVTSRLYSEAASGIRGLNQASDAHPSFQLQTKPSQLRSSSKLP
jgi:hypothetical protein